MINRIFFRSALIIASLHVMLASCHNGGKDSDSEKVANHAQSMSETYVDTMRLTVSTFNRQVVCNGRIIAREKSDLRFTNDGITLTLHVKEGQRVRKGELIATLDKEQKRREVEKAEHDLLRAKVELTDKLIGLGYDADMKGVPEDVMQRAEVTSGYYSAKYQLATACAALEECDLRAPFSGRIANLEAKAHQRSDKICTLIDDSAFDVEFKVLEAELESVSKGLTVKISPFISEELVLDGIVTNINPQVDEKGLVKVTAKMTGRNDRLIDGMNVRIVVEQRVDDMFVVPKDAVVERDGYHVIFRYKDGKAVWTYVDVLYSNINSFAITGCKRKETSISEGDIVITSGNLNLADGTEVKI